MLTACSRSAPAANDMPPPLAALATPLTASELVVRDAANAFAFSLWGRVNAAQRDTNVLLSPLSGSLVLGMVLNGAANETAREMHATLHLRDVSLADINQGYRLLVSRLVALDPSVTMSIANSIWYRQDFLFRQEFVDTARVYFGATVRGLNFSDAAPSLAAVNEWAAGATNRQISSVLTAIQPTQVMFLINATYFKGSWRQKFDPARTESSTFFAADRVAQPVRLMQRTDSLPYAESSTFQAADVPYGNTAFSMTVLLPRADSDVETLAASMTPESWRAIIASLQTRKVAFSLPALRLQYDRSLNDDLKTLGMRAPFADAYFTLMALPTSDRSLSIDFVRQHTFIDINESGTEAAAVTAVGMQSTTMSVIPVMRVDRPYLILLRERLTGTVLFMGKIVRMPH
jgi:serine protease inhibitor